VHGLSRNCSPASTETKPRFGFGPFQPKKMNQSPFSGKKDSNKNSNRESQTDMSKDPSSPTELKSIQSARNPLEHQTKISPINYSPRNYLSNNFMASGTKTTWESKNPSSLYKKLGNLTTGSIPNSPANPQYSPKALSIYHQGSKGSYLLNGIASARTTISHDVEKRTINETSPRVAEKSISQSNYVTKLSNSELQRKTFESPVQQKRVGNLYSGNYKNNKAI